MFSYYGSKSKIVDLYPKPLHDKIIEPFAGSARYSLKWFERDILLVDKYEVIVRLWKWLQQVTPRDILSLPVIERCDRVSNHKYLSNEERILLGFLVKAGSSSPRNTPGTLNGIDVKHDLLRISKNLFKIKHWEIRLGSYDDIPNSEATWFLDPPYQYGGEYYIKSNKQIDFNALANWCKERIGQAIVCENTKANWLPFIPMKRIQGSDNTFTTEAIWSNLPTAFDWQQQKLF